MKFKISGVRKKSLKEEIREALSFFAKELDVHDYDDVTVSVKALRNMDALGYCSIMYYDDKDRISNILMEVKLKQSKGELISTLAHEMVHVKQYLAGEINENLDVWKGNPVNSDDINYEDHPWEIEADKVGDMLDEKWNERQ